MTDKTTTIHELREAVAAFVDERDWRQFHDPKNLAMSIAIEAAELMEHFQWLRTDQVQPGQLPAEERAQFAEELADVLCFALSFANATGIDITAAVTDKLEKNARKYPADEFRGRFR